MTFSENRNLTVIYGRSWCKRILVYSPQLLLVYVKTAINQETAVTSQASRGAHVIGERLCWPAKWARLLCLDYSDGPSAYQLFFFLIKACSR